MGKNKQIVINMIAQIISFLVAIGISFFLTPFMVKNVGSEAYGFVGMANDFVSYAAVISFALNSMASRYITISLHQEKYEDVNKYFTSVLFANLAISLFLTIPFTVLLFTLNKFVSIPNNILLDVTLLLGFVFLNFLLNIMGSVFNISIFSKNKLNISSSISIVSSILKALILITMFLFLKPSVWYLGFSAVISTIYIIGANIYYTKKLLPNVSINRNYFDISKVKTLISSGLWNSFTKLSSILSTGTDLLITNLFISASAMGTLSISKTLPNMILSIFAMLAGAFSPQLTISYAKKDIKGMQKELIYSMKIMGLFACIPMAILFAYGDAFYGLWVPSQDAKLLQILSILNCFAFIFALPMEGLWNIFTVTNKVKQSSIYLFFNSILTIILVLILLNFSDNVKTKLFIIAGTSTIFSIIRALTFLPLYGARCLNLKWNTFYPVVIKNVIAVTLVTIISFFIKDIIIIDSWIMLIVAAFLTTIVSIIINFVLILSKYDRNLLLKGVKNKITRSKINLKTH
ncbi:oligosaccharide flippase family protein [Neobacillus drentensis]|uniref:oligosaccharide flippase family protein n=1 Tax=Neobacillus drentensis TaxID=220684 RepID=UPI002FFD7F33